jgi:hypothetical protein
MFLSQDYIQPSGQCYQYDSLVVSPVKPIATALLDRFGSRLMSSLTRLTHLLFLRIHMFVKELKNECQNYQWRRNRQGDP